jgi:hypothetical protein
MGLALFGCAPGMINLEEILKEMDIVQNNKNLASNIGNTFVFVSATKDGTSIVGNNNISTTNGIPIIITFNGGIISGWNIKIEKVNDDGDTVGSVNITQTKVWELSSDVSELWIYTEELEDDTTYQATIKASGTYNTLGVKLDSDGDGIGGEPEDDLVTRFTTDATPGSVVVDKLPAPLAGLISVPNLEDQVDDPTHLQHTNYVITNDLTDSTNGGNIDTTALSRAYKLINLTDGKTYNFPVSYNSGEQEVYTTVSGTLPLGAYRLYRDNRLIKEAAPIHGYIHRASYNDGIVVDGVDIEATTFRVISTNTLPAVGIGNATALGENWVELEFDNVDMDTSTLNKNNIWLEYDANRNIFNRNWQTRDTKITIMDARTIRLTSTDPGLALDTDNAFWRIQIVEYKVKSEFGDVIGFGTITRTW